MRNAGFTLDTSFATSASGELLESGVRWLEETGRWPGRATTGIPKGVYSFLSLAERQSHDREVVARNKARSAFFKEPPGAHSAPAALRDLRLLLSALHHHDAPYVLTGGWALIARGYFRATEDIDILVPPTRHAGERVRAALLETPGQGIAVDLSPECFHDSVQVRVADSFVVDIMLEARGEDWDSLAIHRQTFHWGDLPVRTLDTRGLLKTLPPEVERFAPLFCRPRQDSGLAA